MAVSVGIDVGNATSCVALARGTAVDVVLNFDGQRETPTAMYYGKTARTVGLKSSSRYATQPRSTVMQVKRLIGRTYTEIQRHEEGMLLYDIRDGGKDQQGRCLISIPAPTGTSCPPLLLRPEQVMASVLKQLSRTAAAKAGSEITKHVLSIPCFYRQAERESMLAAAQVAGLSGVSLIHELTATALCWGSAKRNLPDEKPKIVAFVDVGHSATQVRNTCVSGGFSQLLLFFARVVDFKARLVKIALHSCNCHHHG